MNTRYKVILSWSSEDEAFIAEVPELPGCAADGATRQEALANVEVVVGEWIETARELGRPIPEPKGRLGIPADRKTLIKEKAEDCAAYVRATIVGDEPNELEGLVNPLLAQIGELLSETGSSVSTDQVEDLSDLVSKELIAPTSYLLISLVVNSGLFEESEIGLFSTRFLEALEEDFSFLGVELFERISQYGDLSRREEVFSLFEKHLTRGLLQLEHPGLLVLGKPLILSSLPTLPQYARIIFDNIVKG